MAWHCSMVSKLQDVIAEVTSLRQYSPADAGVADAAKAAKPRATNAAAGAALILQNWLILRSLFLLCVCRLFSLAPEMGSVRSARHARMPDALSNLLSVRAPLQALVRGLLWKPEPKVVCSIVAMAPATAPGVETGKTILSTEQCARKNPRCRGI
jgi:hypothetical protein